MTKRIFELEWDEELGEMWMNEDNLAICLYTDTHTSANLVAIKDVTEEKMDEIKTRCVKGYE